MLFKESLQIFIHIYLNNHLSVKDYNNIQVIPMSQKQVPTSHPQTFIHNLLFPKKCWTQEQDQLLLAAVERCGANKWSHIAKYVPGRLGKQCRERWYNHLSPSINRADWTQQEQWLLYLGYTLMGSKWAKLTRILPGRTDNCIKNHWNSAMRKKIQALSERFNNINVNAGDDSRSKAFYLLKTLNSIILQQLRITDPALAIDRDSKMSAQESPKPHLHKQHSVDSLSFSNILRKIDENQNTGLQRQESYKYRGWNEISSSKEKNKAINSLKMMNFGSGQEQQKPESSKTLVEKENVLGQIHNFLEEADIPLPLPMRRLSSIDYCPILAREGSTFPSSD